MPRLRESFRPEFLNRIDEVIVFKRLDAEQLRRITDLLLDETRERLSAQDIGIAVTEAAVDRLAELGFQPEFGARPLRRTIQRQVGNRLSAMLLSDELHAGQSVTVDVGRRRRADVRRGRRPGAAEAGGPAADAQHVIRAKGTFGRSRRPEVPFARPGYLAGSTRPTQERRPVSASVGDRIRMHSNPSTPPTGSAPSSRCSVRTARPTACASTRARRRS